MLIRTTLRPLTFVTLVLLLWLATGPRAASAHSALEAASPPLGSEIDAMPAEISLRFTEAVYPDSVKLQLSTIASASPALGDVALSSDSRTLTAPVRTMGSEPQTVSIGWSVVSAIDGQETSGLLIFTVAAARPRPLPI